MSPDLASLGIQVNPRGPIEQRVACPQCSRRERDYALGVNVETGMFHCFRCGWAGRVSGESRPHVPVVACLDDPAVIERKRQRLRETWSRSVPLCDRRALPVVAYLTARGLGEVLRDPPAALRAHPGLEYWDGWRLLGRYPAMIGLFAGSAGEPITLHATYLRSDGWAKASVPSPKKILGVAKRGATRGGAIRLYPPCHGVLAVGEGIESALSFRVLKQFPVWASFCADNLAGVRLPENLRELHIGMDIDASGKGEQVAQKLAARVQRWRRDIRITLWRPEIDGLGDLNDELMHRRAT